jgi:hypothetical protein
MAHFRQMRLPQRDQTETRAAVREPQTYLTGVRTSPWPTKRARAS